MTLGMFVWTFEGVMRAIGAAIAAVILGIIGILFLALWVEEKRREWRKRRNAGK